MTEPAPVATFSDTLEAVSGVEGWMTDDQAQRLWSSSSKVPTGGKIVEIGSFRGRSTIVLARAADPEVQIFAIDPHAGNDRGPQEIEGFEDEAEQDNGVFERNLSGAAVRHRVRHLRKFSNEAHPDVDGSIELLYIDGAHRFGPAYADISEWGKRVPTGGTMLIHDSFSSIGVTLAIMRALFLSSEFRYIGRSQSMAEYRREHLKGGARLRNLGRQLVELPWFVRNVIIKVLITAKLGKLTRFLGHHNPAVWPY